MIYVGAVTVLFLFVVMMINPKKVIPKPFFLFEILTLLSMYFFFIFHSFFKKDFPISSTLTYFSENSNLVANNLTIISKALYHDYNIAFLISGYILLIALIGSILLTINLKKEEQDKKENKFF
jgi:NADH-quinone oxidoreductase subunit J